MTSHPTRRRSGLSPLTAVVVLIVLGMLAAACGQRPGVHGGSDLAFDEGGDAFDDDFDDGFDDDAGDGFDDFDDSFDEGGDDGFGDIALEDSDDDGGDGNGNGGGTPSRSPSGPSSSPSGGGNGGGGSNGNGGGEAAGEAQPSEPGDEEPAGDGGGEGGDGGGDGGDGGGNGGGGNGGGGGDDDGGGSDGPREARGSDTTGLTDDTIAYGAHAPVTGAAPLPARSFEQASDLYWRYLTEVQGETVVGRSNVEVRFADDRYQPSTAVQVCRELADDSFFLFGAGGTDQIQQCGRYANQNAIPYFSAGVTTAGLEGLPWYFAFSMTYRDQGRLLAQYVNANFSGQKVAAVLTDTANFEDAVQGWERGVQEQGLDYYETKRPPRGDTTWYNSYARDLDQAGVEVVYVNMAPVDYLRFAQQAQNQGYEPQFVGVGITMGLNPLLGQGCENNAPLHGGVFFSPFPGLDWAEQHAPDFFQAAEQLGTPNDDLAFALWGQSKALHELFNRYEAEFGSSLTREEFRNFVENQQDIAGDIFPSVSYSPDNHFGANQVHVLQADCGKRQHVTLDTFSSSF